MKNKVWAIVMVAMCAAYALAGCSGGITDGDYAIEVDTDSNMFHAESCILHVQDGQTSASLTLPGEGFSRLYFGTSEEAETADANKIYEYYLNDDGLYTFDIPVEALDQELQIAAFGQRRNRWYDHTIIFQAPTTDARIADSSEPTDKAA